MKFSWDENKNRVNFKKHGIRFEEATLIFDSIHFTRVDPRDYYDEKVKERLERLPLGHLGGGAVLVVCHTNRNSQTRIISARKATSKERRRYNETFKNTAF